MQADAVDNGGAAYLFTTVDATTTTAAVAPSMARMFLITLVGNAQCGRFERDGFDDVVIVPTGGLMTRRSLELPTVGDYVFFGQCPVPDAEMRMC